MNSIASRQINVDLISDRDGVHFRHKEQDCDLPSMDKVHAFFQKQSVDIVKLSHKGKKSYLRDTMVFDTKKALRKALSQESGGAWVEEKNEKKRYFIDDGGWLNFSWKQVSKEDYLQRLQTPSTTQKVLGIGLGILALLPGALEIKERLPFGAKETGMGLLALQQRSSLVGIVGYSLFSSTTDAQAVGTEFQANTYTTNIQERPSITSTNDGGFIITWQSSGQDGDGYGVFAQRYNSRGIPIDFEFQANNYTMSDQGRPKVASLNDGGFVIVWESNGQDGSFEGIYGQRYNNNGTLFGSEFQVNTHTSSTQWRPSVAPLNDGGFVVSWASYLQDESDMGVFAQRYDANGNRNGTEFQVNTETLFDQLSPTIIPLNDGGFAIHWSSWEQDGDNYGIYGQRYRPSGTKNGAEYLVNSYTTSRQTYPSSTLLNDGGFVVAWSSFGQDGDNDGVFSQRYDSSVTPNGLEFQVSTYTTNWQEYSTTTSLKDGGFVICWQSYGQIGISFDVFAQRYDSMGMPIGSEFQVNTQTTDFQQYPSVARLEDGGFVVVWESDGQDGDGSGIFGQRFHQNGSAVSLTYLAPSSSTSLSTQSSQISLTDASVLASSTSNGVSITNRGQSSKLNSSSSQTSNDVRTTNTPNSQLSLADSSTSTNRPPSASSTEILSTEEWISTTSRVSLAPSTIPSSSRSTTTIHSIYEIEYGENYSITENGQIIGTYSISGGNGLYNSANPNVLEIQLDPNHGLEDGDTVTLFIVPDGEEPTWQDVVLSNDESECISVEGVYVEDPEEHSYQLIFNLEPDTCTVNQGLKMLSAIPVLANGGLI